jgi:hypothetical protein
VIPVYSLPLVVSTQQAAGIANKLYKLLIEKEFIMNGMNSTWRHLRAS